MADSFIGEIRIFAGNYAPVDWLFCDGSLLNITEYQTLYALIGTAYGGNGNTTFALPNLNGKLPVGQGSGPNLTPRTIAQTFGVTTVSLTSNQLPSHLHTIQASNNPATTITPGPTLALGTIASPSVFYDLGNSVPANQRAFNSQAFSLSGGSTPHENTMPTLSLSYIISTAGMYPSQS
ncbi:phage tail protein [Solimicrobium silvestre]|uniref:Microcystin-dependent protein n=1 Tax=Solimicrobium silvestre TaxID=2099400 RepID=A0A2S9H562_9BURK|nr:tail fiber protein [Solimicrobium silvestre]PRC95006.1 Microcystin-dependent protein [Solimicrobium silvestre]